MKMHHCEFLLRIDLDVLNGPDQTESNIVQAVADEEGMVRHGNRILVKLAGQQAALDVQGRIDEFCRCLRACYPGKADDGRVFLALEFFDAKRHVVTVQLEEKKTRLCQQLLKRRIDIQPQASVDTVGLFDVAGSDQALRVQNHEAEN